MTYPLERGVTKVPPAQIPQRDIIDAQMAFFGFSKLTGAEIELLDYERLVA